MDASDHTSSRRPRRSKAAIEAAIHKAAISQIKKNGFAGALVTNIVKQAKIEPIVFYNRYKNLDDFYENFAKRFDNWVTNATNGEPTSSTAKSEIALTIELIMNSLVTDKLMIEMLRWEVADRNEITQRSLQLREQELEQLVKKLIKHVTPLCSIDGKTLISLIIAGIYYLALLKDRTSFAGININTPDGKQQVSGAVSLLEQLLAESTSDTAPRSE